MKILFDYNGKVKNKYYKETSEGNKNFNKGSFFKEITQYLNKNDVLCEFGCGDGSKLKHFKKHVREVWGFDISKEAIRRAKKNIPEGNFFVSNSGKIFKDKQFDVTICLYTLEHVEDPKKFIDEMINVTKKGGYIICLCPNFGSPLFPSPPELIDKNFIERVLLVLRRLKNYRSRYRNKLYKNVKPILDKEWKPDYDTSSEVSLERVVKLYKNNLILAKSFWHYRPFLYLPFWILAFFRIKPIIYFGFNCFFILKKH
jgi:ubiquinone/menaquinone biosynthesis C-methylase UbiE